MPWSRSRRISVSTCAVSCGPSDAVGSSMMRRRTLKVDGAGDGDGLALAARHRPDRPFEIDEVGIELGERAAASLRHAPLVEESEGRCAIRGRERSWPCASRLSAQRQRLIDGLDGITPCIDRRVEVYRCALDVKSRRKTAERRLRGSGREPTCPHHCGRQGPPPRPDERQGRHWKVPERHRNACSHQASRRAEPLPSRLRRTASFAGSTTLPRRTAGCGSKRTLANLIVVA